MAEAPTGVATLTMQPTAVVEVDTRLDLPPVSRRGSTTQDGVWQVAQRITVREPEGGAAVRVTSPVGSGGGQDQLAATTAVRRRTPDRAIE
ncbi:MAG: hypothetical protein ABR564_00175 [Candidatus Dormibacteria bacterium]